MKFRIGVMVLGAVLAAVILVMVFGGHSSQFQRTYTICVKFPSVSGLSTGAPVRKNGIRIGEVSKIELAAKSSLQIPENISISFDGCTPGRRR